MPSTDSNAPTAGVEEVDERLRSKYMNILQSLSINELKRFQLDKHRYKQMVVSDFQEILPNLAPDTIDGRAQCISNMLNNEAPKIRGRKSKQTVSDKSTKGTASTDSVPTPKEKDTQTRDSSAIKQGNQSLTESLLHELDNTLTDPNDTINTTMTLSQMDATYEDGADSDDSITLVKRVQKAQQNDKSGSQTT